MVSSLVRVLIGALLAAAAYYAYSYWQTTQDPEQPEIAACVSNGFCWDYVANQCRGLRENQQAVCDQSMGKESGEQLCKCLRSGGDTYICGVRDEFLAFDTPNRDALMREEIDDALKAYNCNDDGS